jgi:hypothetical protein
MIKQNRGKSFFMEEEQIPKDCFTKQNNKPTTTVGGL